jgi:hypothetical protein
MTAQFFRRLPLGGFRLAGPEKVVCQSSAFGEDAVMTLRRFQVRYTPRHAVIAAAKGNGWTEESGDSLLDACGDHFSFEVADSNHKTLEAAVERAKQLILDELDLFGETSVEEQEYVINLPEGFGEWERVARSNIDETGLVETVREDECA